MIKYDMLNKKLYNSQLNNLKSWIKYGTQVALKLSSNLIGSSYDETNFPLLTDTQVSKICKAFAVGSSANRKSSKTQLPKIVELGGFLFGPPNLFPSNLYQLKK